MLKNGLILLSSIALLAVTQSVSSDPLEPTVSKAYDDCGSTRKARTLAQLIITDSEQLRPRLVCNKLLSAIAQDKAEQMARAGEVSHDGIGGTPDQRLLASGYNLYLPAGAFGDNHVESILGGTSSADLVLDQLSNSYSHRVHIFAEHEFYLTQDEIGVGYFELKSSPHVDYWVVYIAKQEHKQGDTD